MNAEGRERFFRAIAERIDVERVEEVHVFPAIRQGGRESGVAVLTLRPEPTESDIAATANASEDAAVEDDHREDGHPESDLSEGDLPEGDNSDDASDVAFAEGAGGPDDVIRADVAEDADGDVDAGEEPVESTLPPPPPRRFTVLRAHYRLQLKGPDRGKWEVAVVEEADAPSATVDEVVRGVHERAGGWSVEGPERLTGDEFRAALVEEPWSATR